MYGSICGIVLIGLVLSGSINFGSCQSPCPDYFSYLTDDITGEVTGRIAIPNAPKDVALHLRISLSVPTTLPTKYVGTLELESSKSESVKAVRAGRPLIYRLRFPLRNPIPLLTEITFNKQRYCTGPRADGQVVTTIFLEHTLFPPGVMPLSDNPSASTSGEPFNVHQPSPEFDISSFDFSPPISDTKPDWNSVRPAFPTVEKRPTVVEPVRRPRPEVRPSVPFQPPTRRPQPEVRPSVQFEPPTRKPQPEVPFVLKHPSESTIPKPSSDKNNENCGRANPGGVNYLIANGERTSPGQWPWLAAIFVTKIEYEFCCGGSLITDKHIITAAHCKYQNGMYVEASAFLVSLGRYHLLHWRERGSKNHEVLKFTTHPDYHDRGSADADLAMITLRERVEFTPRIRPLCLWYGSNDLQGIVGRFGYVVGWGRDEHGERVLEPRMAQMPIVSQEDCLRSHKSFKKATSNRTLCAGLRDGSGPCNGDSGGGLVIRDVSTDRYYLRGVVSLSLTSTSMGCDLSSYTIYADAAMYMDWIRTNSIS